MLRGDAPRGMSKQQQQVSIRFLRGERTSKKFSVRVGEGATKIRDERHDRRDLRLPVRLACGCERNTAIQARPFSRSREQTIRDAWQAVAAPHICSYRLSTSLEWGHVTCTKVHDEEEPHMNLQQLAVAVRTPVTSVGSSGSRALPMPVHAPAVPSKASSSSSSSSSVRFMHYSYCSM